ncbi:uncharacterized protein LOC113290785 [Papaver somniferum]|uniref:uncharacterized protein LOC113290785 n=1 Tax=Papaver somniferum TaxID=3469 RepID=UPI000E6FE73F|nr:uncharacterized protein LOC113290785 [Papaver somniferum]
MTLLIPGCKSPGQDIDVFLRPLVNTLKKLWHQGVQDFDSLKREYFNLKETLMFGIHDLPAQGVLSGCTTHVYCECVCCAEETRSTHLGYGNKIVYTNYRIFLKSRNPFRDETLLGLETREHKSAPLRLTGAQSLEKLADVQYEPGKLVVRKTGKRKRYQSDEEEGDSELVTGAFFKKCILWELESYCALTIRNCVDVMHMEKNVMVHIIYTIFDKDNKAIVAWNNRDKLKENKLHSGEWKEKKTEKGVEMLQHAFPGEKDVRTTLQQVSMYFRILCSKVVSREYLNQAKWMIAEAMCVLKKYFLARFFDISVHNMVHLADEALVCGPAMKECKNILNNNRYIEGSITKSTEMDDCVRFGMEHMKNADEFTKKIWSPSYRMNMNSAMWVLCLMKSQFRDYCENCEADGVAIKQVEMQTKFLSWLYKKYADVLILFSLSYLRSEDKMDTYLWCYVRGPVSRKEYKRYCVNGFSFCSQANPEKAKTRDSGVTVVASTTFRSSKRDKRPVTNLTRWYGVIRQILELNYGTFKETVFYYNWVKVENGAKICQDSDFPLVNLSRLKSHTNISDEPVILAEEAAQVFYSRDVKHPDWWVYIHTPRGMTAYVDKAEIPGRDSFQDILEEEPHLRKLMEKKRLPRSKK